MEARHRPGSKAMNVKAAMIYSYIYMYIYRKLADDSQCRQVEMNGRWLDGGRRGGFGLAEDDSVVMEHTFYRISSSDLSLSSLLQPSWSSDLSQPWPSSLSSSLFSFFTQTPQEFMKKGPPAMHATQNWKNAFVRVRG